MKVIKTIVIGIFVSAVVAMRITNYFKFKKWQVSLRLIAVSCVLYLLSAILTKYFIKKRIPDFDSSEEVLPDTQKWELTAGLGIVPKWVSMIGLLSISVLVTAFLPWIISFLK